MATQYPFTISKRKDRPFYYVRFKNETTGKHLPGKSTGTADKNKAIKIALQWYSTGIRPTLKKSDNIETQSLKDIVKKGLFGLSQNEKMFILEELKKENFIKSYVLTGSKQDVRLIDFMLDFWNYEKSEYLAEKRRKGKRIGKPYLKTAIQYTNKYWKPFFQNKLLGNVTRQDLRDFMQNLDTVQIGNSSKKHIMHIGTKTIKWAYENELIEKDVSAGLETYDGKSNERQILTPELVQAVFSIEWNDPRAKLASMLAMCTGLRAGEIQALRLRDLGQNCLYIQHSWNMFDGLKSTKNGENRTVYLPFPEIINSLKQLAESNPYNQGLDGFVFWATIPNKPMESKTFLYELRQALLKIGLSKDTVKKYTFHAWRHFFTAYMNEKVNQKVLQMQTGHKTARMLEHYAEHTIDGDIERLENAQMEIFGNVVKTSPVIRFNNEKMFHDIRKKYKQEA